MALHQDYGELTDEDLLDLLKQGQEGAFDCLYIRYRNKLIAAAYNRIQSRAVAEELVQEVFTDLWHKRFNLVITRNVSSYLFTAVKYEVLDHIRSLKVKHGYLQQLARFEDWITDMTREQLDAEELDYHLNKSINALPDKCREVFKLSRFEHYTIQEIADKLNISPDTAKYHISHALKELRISLKDLYILVAVLFLE
jgi:RNA polymerase sigma-70 factor (ECF subfamily)